MATGLIGGSGGTGSGTGTTFQQEFTAVDTRIGGTGNWRIVPPSVTLGTGGNTPRNIFSGNGTYLATYAGNTRTATSTDGVTWTAGGLTPSGPSGGWIACYGGGLWTMLDANGSLTGAYSTDGGNTWISTSVPSAAGVKAIAYGNGTFVAIGYSTTYFTSPDGTFWTQRALTGITTPGGLVFDGTRFVVVSGAGSNNYSVLTSTDGFNWTNNTNVMNASVNGANQLAYGGGYYVAASYPTSSLAQQIAYSSSPTVWNSTNVGAMWSQPSGLNQYYNQVVYVGGTLFLLTSSTGQAPEALLFDAATGTGTRGMLPNKTYGNFAFTAGQNYTVASIPGASAVVIAPNSTTVGNVAVSTPGTSTWTAPAGCSYVDIFLVGGGGAGTIAGTGSAYSGGGAGGQVISRRLAVTPGFTYTVTIGTGGNGVTGNAGGTGAAGGDSRFARGSTVLLAALGGAGGGQSGPGHAGGAAGPSITNNAAGGGGGAGGPGGNAALMPAFLAALQSTPATIGTPMQSTGAGNGGGYGVGSTQTNFATVAGAGGLGVNGYGGGGGGGPSGTGTSGGGNGSGSSQISTHAFPFTGAGGGGLAAAVNNYGGFGASGYCLLTWVA